MTTELWGSINHNAEEQLNRQKSACTKKLTPLSVDKTRQTAMFEGSKGTYYYTTIAGCDCVDFSRRKKPCKHMYRLAYELSIFDLSNAGDVMSGIPKSKLPYTVDQLIEILSEKDARYLKSMLYNTIVAKNDFHFAKQGTSEYDSAEVLFGLGLLVEKQHSPEEAAKYYTVPDIKRLMDSCDIPYPKKAYRAELVRLAIEKAGDVLLLHLSKKIDGQRFILNPDFELLWSNLFGTLRKVYTEPEYQYDLETGNVTFVDQETGEVIIMPYYEYKRIY